MLPASVNVSSLILMIVVNGKVCSFLHLHDEFMDAESTFDIG
jgi:hypothetical protein